MSIDHSQAYTLTKQEVKDLLEALACAKNELCCGPNFPEANDIELRWSILEAKLLGFEG